MLIKNYSRLFAVMATLSLAIAFPSPASARPSLWWDHFESKSPNQSECVKQAEGILQTEKSAQTSSDQDSVRSWSGKSIAVAECIPFGEKLIVSIMVSSEDAAAGSSLYNALKTGIAKK